MLVSSAESRYHSFIVELVRTCGAVKLQDLLTAGAGKLGESNYKRPATNV